MQVSAGRKHTLFLDAFGRVFSCGDNEVGQLGIISRPYEDSPTLIPNFNDMAQMIAAGSDHSLILTKSGLVYAFGTNSESQLGLPAKRGSTTPVCIQDISHIPMCFIAAGSFSASIAAESKSLYLWGRGTFGEFQYPHRVKKITQPVQSVAIGHEFGVALTHSQVLYSWGDNSQGQLGTGDLVSTGTPKQLSRIQKETRSITSIACGSSFVLCLSQHNFISD